MGDGEPVLTALWAQIGIQFSADQCTLGLNIKFPGLAEAITESGALLGDPEGMFKADKDGYQCNSKEQEI